MEVQIYRQPHSEHLKRRQKLRINRISFCERKNSLFDNQSFELFQFDISQPKTHRDKSKTKTKEIYNNYLWVRQGFEFFHKCLIN